MSDLPYDPLTSATARIITEIGEHAAKNELLALQRLEQCARSLCAQLKAIEALED